MTENIESLVTQAEQDVKENHNREVFSLTNALKRRGFPEEDVVVYLDEDAAHELVELNRAMTAIAQNENKSDETLEQYNALELLADAMADRLRDSALTFHLRGISPGHIEQIRKNVVKEHGEDSENGSEIVAREWVAAHIVHVTDAEGNRDERLFTADDAEQLEYLLPTSEYQKIDKAVSNLSFRSAYIEQATDAGFLQKS